MYVTKDDFEASQKEQDDKLTELSNFLYAAKLLNQNKIIRKTPNYSTMLTTNFLQSEI